MPLLDWQQWCDWAERHRTEPWGEWRADQRQMVMLYAMLAPYMKNGCDFPNLTYPYFDPSEESAPDIDSAAEAIRRHKEKYGLT